SHPRLAQRVAVERDVPDGHVAHPLFSPVGTEVSLGLLRGAKIAVIYVTAADPRPQRYRPRPAVLVRVRPGIRVHLGCGVAVRNVGRDGAIYVRFVVKGDGPRNLAQQRPREPGAIDVEVGGHGVPAVEDDTRDLAVLGHRLDAIRLDYLDLGQLALEILRELQRIDVQRRGRLRGDQIALDARLVRRVDARVIVGVTVPLRIFENQLL